MFGYIIGFAFGLSREKMLRPVTIRWTAIFKLGGQPLRTLLHYMVLYCITGTVGIIMIRALQAQA